MKPEADPTALRLAALREAAAAMCRGCKAYPSGRFVTVDGRLWHYHGTLGYASGGTRDLIMPCAAAPIRKLMGESE